MLSTLRRGPASLPRLLQSISHASNATRLSPTRATTWIIAERNGCVSNARFFRSSALLRQETAAIASETPGSDNGPITRFEELEARGLVHPSIVRTITDGMGFSEMTDVQTATVNEALNGDDLVGQAKTGTGKTMAFLLPIFQKIIAEDPSLAERRFGQRTSPDDIRALVVSPTRELAEQIAAEARTLARNSGVIIQSAVGGTQKREMLAQTQRQGCHVLIGTPGRLQDLLSDPYSGVKAPKLSMLVLDEADRLLDSGFWTDVQRIQEMLPSREQNNIQTMMFSATVPQEVVSAVRQTLRPGFRFVKCVRDDEEPTHERVPQKLVRVKGFENHLPAVVELSQLEIEARNQDPSSMPYKAIVYLNSTAMVELTTTALHNLGRRQGSNPLHGIPVFGMHSRLTQVQRTRASDSFRNAKSAILVSSDVTSRGMDFPNVTHVIQLGVPGTTESYIHRLGRTARAGKPGSGYLLISPLEEPLARRRLGMMPLKPDTSLAGATTDMTTAGQIPARVANIFTGLAEAHRAVPRETMGQAYQSLLGYFQGLDDKRELIQAMNTYSRYGWGLSQPPYITPALARRLGIANVPGVNLGSEMQSSGYQRDSYSQGGRGSGYGGGRNSGYGGSRDSGSGRGGDAFDQVGMGSRSGQQRSRPRQW